MARPYINVEGDKKLIAQLKAFGSKTTAKRLMRKGIASAGQVVVKAAKSNVPKDTGTLKKSIKKKVIGKGFGMSCLVGADAKVLGPYKGKRQLIPSYYDHLVEFGFQMPDGKTVPAHSFLRKGFNESKKAAQAAFESKLKEAIEREAAKR